MANRGTCRVGVAKCLLPSRPAALAEDEVLGIGHVLDNFVGLGVPHHSAPGHADDEIFAVLAPAAGALAVLAVGSYIFSLIAKVHQGGEIVVHPEDDAAAVAAVAAVGAALGDVLLPVKGHGAVAAVAGLHGDFYLIDKHIFIAFLRCMGFLIYGVGIVWEPVRRLADAQCAPLRFTWKPTCIRSRQIPKL